MILRRDHIASIGLLAFAAAVLVLSQELPFGTPASPGPGMLPLLSVGILIALSLVLLFQAGKSPALTEIEWDDVPHAARVMSVAVAAACLYTTLGFLVTMWLMLFALTFVIERVSLAPALAVSTGMAGGAYLLLSTLLKAPMPQGVLGI